MGAKILKMTERQRAPCLNSFLTQVEESYSAVSQGKDFFFLLFFPPPFSILFIFSPLRVSLFINHSHNTNVITGARFLNCNLTAFDSK